MRGRTTAVIAGVSALGVGLGAWVMRSNTDVQYRTAAAERGDIAYAISATGTPNAVVTVQVGSQVSGNIKALYADFNTRVEERIANWNSLTELEVRAADSYEPTGGRYAEIPMPIYEGEEVWAEQLPQGTKLVMSKEYARRVRHLVATNRISYDEYRMLTGLPW
jgi:hypothetical protein